MLEAHNHVETSWLLEDLQLESYRRFGYGFARFGSVGYLGFLERPFPTHRAIHPLFGLTKATDRILASGDRSRAEPHNFRRFTDLGRWVVGSLFRRRYIIILWNTGLIRDHHSRPRGAMMEQYHNCILECIIVNRFPSTNHRFRSLVGYGISLTDNVSNSREGPRFEPGRNHSFAGGTRWQKF